MEKREILQRVINILVDKGVNKWNSGKHTKQLFRKWYYEEINKGHDVYFATFTFKEEYNFLNFKNWNRKQFVDYLKKTCKINAILYADFGLENNRFHLHGFISTKHKLDIKNKDYFNKFGFSHFEKAKEKNIHYIVKYSLKMNLDFRFRTILTRGIDKCIPPQQK